MTTTKTIPLNTLRPWEGNVRKTVGSDTALAELAASIASIGLIQPLSVRKGRGDNFEVVAGARRLAALKQLVKAGNIKADHPVPCMVIAEHANATEISLAENAVREDMHPADQFEAFRKLSGSGLPAADIAAKFGVTESVVLARLKLANVSPVIVKAYREDEISLEIVMAFAVTDDQKAQEKLWKATPKYHRQAYNIRRALTETEITASDRRVKVVGLKAYEKAGGKTRTDLFTEGEEGVFILGVDLLNDLFNRKLESVATKVRAEGWKWTEQRDKFDHGKFRQLDQEYAPLPAKERKKLDELTEQREQLEAEDASWDDINAIEEKIDAINEAREEQWSSESLAMAGAVIYVDYHGKIRIERGLIRPEDEKKRKEKAPGKAASEDKAEEEPPVFRLSWWRA